MPMATQQIGYYGTSSFKTTHRHFKAQKSSADKISTLLFYFFFPKRNPIRDVRRIQ